VVRPYSQWLRSQSPADRWIQADLIAFALRSAEFLGESDEKPFRSADEAKPIRILIPNYLAPRTVRYACEVVDMVRFLSGRTCVHLMIAKLSVGEALSDC
jgi:hypothetical protein